MNEEGKKRKRKAFSVRTDLAVEAGELQRGLKKGRQPAGVETEIREGESFLLTHVRITTKEGSERMGKPMGNYITIESEKLREQDAEYKEKLTRLTAECLSPLVRRRGEGSVLVAGLGNRYITPDALGPKVAERILVTRHLKESLPAELAGKVCSAAAVSPGVMGITGIETGEILKGIAERMQPSLIIAVDALAARSSHRINGAVQISDAGISPGAGVGNKRKLLNEETMGVPVIAVGVPTVVDAATLVSDTMDSILASMKAQSEKGSAFYEMLEGLHAEERYDLIADLLEPYGENLFVTPKEVDAVVERLADILAGGINLALHPNLTAKDMEQYF